MDRPTMLNANRSLARRCAAPGLPAIPAIGLAVAALLAAPAAPGAHAAVAWAQSAETAAGAPAASAPPALTEELLKPFAYRPIGPANMSGRVTAFAVPDAPGHKTIYAGFATGGVWKTTNRGTTWQPVFNDEAFAAIGDVAVAPSDADVVWVGTGERNSLRSQGWGDGVYKSTNGGRSWTHMGLDDTREIGRIVIHPTDPKVVYVAALGHLWGANSERGVYKTTDGGESWERVLFVDDTTGIIDLRMDPKNPDVLYAAGWHRLRWGGGRMEGAGAGSGIWKTTDGGATWTRLTDPALDNGLPSGALGRIGLALHPVRTNVVYAVIQVARGAHNPGVSPHGGLFRSDDAGATWTRVNDLSAVPDYYYNEVWLDPSDDAKVILNGTFLMRSEDGGRTFERFDLGRVHVDHHAMWIDPDDSDTMLLGNDGGIYVSYDGGDTWGHHALPVGQFYEIDVDTTRSPYHVCGGLQDNGVWCGPSRTRERVGITDADWYSVYGGDGFRSTVAPDSPAIRFAESQFGSISRWDVDEWDYVPIQPHAEDAGVGSGYAFRWDWNTPFVISQHDPTILYLGGNHLFKLTDRGRDWTILGPDMTRQNRRAPEPITGPTSYGSLHSIAESPLDANVLWTGSNDGLIWVTRDGGATWTQVTDNIPDDAPKHCWAGEIEASRFDASTAYLVYDCHRRDDYRPYVYRTTDGGATWTSIAGDLPADAGSYVVREDPVNRDLLFVGNERGVYLTIHGGDRWTRLKNNLPTVAVRDMDIVAREKELVVGTFGRSVWILDIGPIEELADSVLAESAHLFGIRPARRFNTRDTYASFGDSPFRGDNPPSGAVITYYLREDVGRDVSLTIRSAAEATVAATPAAADGAARGASAEGADVKASPADDGRGDDARADGPRSSGSRAGRGAPGDGPVVTTLSGTGRPGMHRVTWDLRSRRPRPRGLGDPTSPNELREVPPGVYTVTLKAGEATLTRTVRVDVGWYERSEGRIR